MPLRLLLRETLQEHYCVQEAADGYQALEIIATHQIDLIVIDMMMPGLNGKETLKQIRVSGYHMPAIIMTGLDIAGIEGHCPPLGAVQYISKPFDVNQLRVLVAQQLVAKK